MTKAVIMAGGHGTRLRPLTSDRPKPMVPVINRPVIEHTINLLKKHGITDIVISLYYLPGNVQNYFGDGFEWDVNITYSVEEDPLGTAGGVKKAIENYDGTIIVMSGDGVVDFDITQMIKYHKKKKSLFTIVLKHVDKPVEYGIVITKKDGTIDKFLEKPAWSEVFSDTVNTGTYIIDSDIIDNYIPPLEKFDFSLDLFPLLQRNDVPIFWYIDDGYWCDIGNLDAYRDSHIDILNGLVKIDFPGKKIDDDVWIGENVIIESGSVIKGPVVLGDFVRVKKGAEISEYSVIGDNCIIGGEASVKRSIVLQNTHIGPKSELRGAIIGKRCVLEENVAVYEGAILSDDCQIGKGAEIPPGIRVWPGKIIEEGTRLTTDLIWGKTEKKTLFGSDGITGSFNIKVTPEFAAKLGSAIGAFLGESAKVIVSRDAALASRLIKWSVMSGMLSMGIDVYDMEVTSIPMNRFFSKFANADLGIYIQKSPLAGLQYIQVKIFNKHGFQISLRDEKKVENIFFRGDYPRKESSEVGKVFYPMYHIEAYISNARKYIDSDLLSQKGWNIIVDCFNGAAAHVFPDLLAGFGCSVTVLRGQASEFLSEEDIKTETRNAIENVVNMSISNREIGVLIGPHGEYLTIIDEMGNIFSDDDVSAMLCQYYLKYKDEKIINVPVTSSKVIDQIAIPLGGKVVRTSSKLRAPDEVEDIFLNCDLGRYPYLENDYDPMITFLNILEFATREDKPLYEIKEKLPKSNLTRMSISCKIYDKAAIMRTMTVESDNCKIELIDGVRIIKEDCWILILPDASLPLIHLYAEGEDIDSRDNIINEYSLKIKRFKQGLTS